MPLRIPERKTPARITIGDAFAHLVRQTIKPDSDIGRAGDVAAATRFAALRVFQRNTLTAAQAARAMPPLDFLDTDPIDIASAILDGITSGKLSVQGLPDELASTWLAQPLVGDWETGLVSVGPGMSGRRCYPTLDRDEIDELFVIGREDVPPSDQNKVAGQVAPAALMAAVREIMASERLTEAQARERAEQRFAPRTFSVTQWRAAWADEPNKLRRGEKPTGKSGA